jgi:protein ImuB
LISFTEKIITWSPNMPKPKLFAVVHTPYFRLQCAQQKRLSSEIESNEQTDLPLFGEPKTISKTGDKILSALLEESQIIEVNPAADAAGVSIGITPSLAQARAPELQLYTPAADQEKQQQDALLQLCYRYSPFIENTSPGVCTLDLRGRRDQLQEWWARQLLAQWRTLGFSAQIGIGPNPELAEQAAKFANPYLAVNANSQLLRSLPLESLQPSQELLDILHNWGIRTLGELVRLPREDIGVRLGLEGLALWDRATGRSTKVLNHLHPPETFRETIDLEQRLETLEPLLFILRRSIEHLTLRVEAVYRLVSEIRLLLLLDNEETLERSLQIPAPTSDVAVLFRVLNQYLETVQTTAPVVGFVLEVFASNPGKNQFDLFQSRLKDPNRFFNTLARLAALVGNNRVGVPEKIATHRPDSVRMQWPAFDWTDKTPVKTKPPRIGPALRRYRPPIPATVELDSGKPATIQSQSINGKINKLSGPWYSSGDWWHTDRWDIQEWDIELAQGGLYRLTLAAGSWSITGGYD